MRTVPEQIIAMRSRPSDTDVTFSKKKKKPNRNETRKEEPSHLARVEGDLWHHQGQEACDRQKRQQQGATTFLGCGTKTVKNAEKLAHKAPGCRNIQQTEGRDNQTPYMANLFDFYQEQQAAREQ